MDGVPSRPSNVDTSPLSRYALGTANIRELVLTAAVYNLERSIKQRLLYRIQQGTGVEILRWTDDGDTRQQAWNYPVTP
jgi:hypothetical protein